MKPDALAHLADALMEDIVATPPHQLAIEEIVDAVRSRETVFRFDDILAEVISSSTDRPASPGSRAIWNLTDGLCEEMAAHPETVLTEVSDVRSDDRSLAGKFDDILRRNRHLAMAGLKLPRQPGPTYPALYLKAAFAQLLDRLTAPLHRRAAAGAFAVVVTAAVVMSVVYQPWRQAVEPDRFAAAPPGAPTSQSAHSALLPAADLAPSPVLAYRGNASSADRSEASPPPPAMAKDGEQRRFAAASPEPQKPSAVSRAALPPAPNLAPLPVPGRGRNAGGAATSEASPSPPAVAEQGDAGRIAAASPKSREPPAVARAAPPPVADLASRPLPADGGKAGSLAKPEAPPPPAKAADEGEKHVAAAPMVSPMMAHVGPRLASPEGRNAGGAAKVEASPPADGGADGGERRVAASQTHTAAAVPPPAAAPLPDRKRPAAERSPVFGGQPEQAKPAAPSIDGPLTPSELPAVPLGLPNRMSAWSGSLVDIETELKALEESARAGDVIALWKLGRIYADGDGVPQNHLRAFEYFRRIADTSNVEDLRGAKARFVANAFVEVGRYYLTGVANSDFKPDPARAHQMFTYAAVYFADADAQYELARTFLDGVGVARDPRQGVRWLYQAAMKGQYDAQAKFGSLLFTGMRQVIPRDAAKGLMWLRIAMDTAPRAAAGSIARIYDAALKQATDEERAAASAYFEQWRISRKLTSESDKMVTGDAPATGAAGERR